MNSKFLVLSAIFFFSIGCAHSADVAKTDMPEDDMVAAAPATQDKPTTSEGSRAPASVDEDSSTVCHKENKKDCNH